MKKSRTIIAISYFCLSAINMTAQTPADTLETTGTRNQTVSYVELGKKTLGDVRNQMTGMIPGLEITERAGGLWNSGNYEDFTLQSNQMQLIYRGSQEITCFIDGVLMPYSIYYLDPSQIESVTLVGDVVGRAKLGPTAAKGALYFKTKQGGYNKPLEVRVNVESGVAMTTVVPEWADGVDYATLNNQARANAGYTQMYSSEAIQGFQRADANDLLYPNVDYRSLMLKDIMPVGNASVSFDGGSDKVKYAAAISELYSGDIIKTDRAQDYNRMNFSSNVTARINRFIEVNAGFNSSISFRRSGAVSWNDWQKVPAVAYPLILGTQMTDDQGSLTNYGTTANWPENYYALSKEGGFSTTRLVSNMMYAKMTFDFGEWVKGLKSETSVSYSAFQGTSVSKTENYLSYYWDPEAEDGLGIISPNHQAAKTSGKSLSSLGANQLLQFSEDLTWNRNWSGHDLTLGASFLMYDASMQSVGYYRRLMQGTGSMRYSYNDKYIVEGVFQCAGSSRFDSDDRVKPFGSVGASWIVSNEDWLKDCGWINKLKLRGQYGVQGNLNSVFGTLYLYRSSYSNGDGYTYGPNLKYTTWFGKQTWTSQLTTINRLANPELTWENTNLWEAGLDFDFLDGFCLTANVYGSKDSNLLNDISQSVPQVFGLGGTSLFANYESRNTCGYELSLGYFHKWNDFSFNMGVSAYHWNTTYDQVVGDDYVYDYQKKAGTCTGAIWGLECIGKYENQAQLDSNPSYGAAGVGDLMYKDKNSDGKIDNNDFSVIGSTQPKLCYSVNLGFNYKRLEMQVVGTGRYGADVALTGSYFWSGWGDGNYSAFIRDNVGGDYPTLSYVMSTNNFVLSDFWLRDASWFKIQDVLLAYDIPVKNQKVIKKLAIQLKGQNLASFTKLEYVDPEAPESGVSSYPLFRTFTAGVKINF